MTLRNTKTIETAQFTTAKELKDWLSLWSDAQLSAIYFEDDLSCSIFSISYISIGIVEETLSDGSKVTSLKL